MKNILFLDPVCPKPYSPHTLRTEPLGGTEATVIRVAEALSVFANVTVCQWKHKFPAVKEGAEYVGEDYDTEGKRWDAVVILRAIPVVPFFRATFRDAKLFVWCHDLPGSWLSHDPRILEQHWEYLTLIAVSETHKTLITEAMKGLSLKRYPRVKHIYNPVTVPDYHGLVNRNKVTFISSPHKGLDRTLELFRLARNFLPALQLYIANPGYFKDREGLSEQDGVINLGAVPQHVALEHVRESLCLFYPNHVFPETFGLVMAEANAVGTPVLTHPFGAAPEVLKDRRQFVDCRDNKQVIDKLVAWHKGDRPKVFADERFDLNVVAHQWKRLLDV